MGKYTFEELKGIIKTLRSENGCPWDREQTHDSLKTCMIEEAAEYAASVRIANKTNDYTNMCEELGDVLLQVLMNSDIAEDMGQFTLDDVIDGISEKMIRRHPHVFGDVEVSNSKEVLVNWEEIKKKEKEDQKWIESPLREVPIELPALLRSTKVQKKALKIYENNKEIKLEDLLEDLKQCVNGVGEQDISAKEIGNILIKITKICAVSKINPEQELVDELEKMIEKYELIP